MHQEESKKMTKGLQEKGKRWRRRGRPVVREYTLLRVCVCVDVLSVICLGDWPAERMSSLVLGVLYGSSLLQVNRLKNRVHHTLK